MPGIVLNHQFTMNRTENITCVAEQVGYVDLGNDEEPRKTTLADIVRLYVGEVHRVKARPFIHCVMYVNSADG